jgi:hypothetical protein
MYFLFVYYSYFKYLSLFLCRIHHWNSLYTITQLNQQSQLQKNTSMSQNNPHYMIVFWILLSSHSCCIICLWDYIQLLSSNDVFYHTYIIFPHRETQKYRSKIADHYTGNVISSQSIDSNFFISSLLSGLISFIHPCIHTQQMIVSSFSSYFV